MGLWEMWLRPPVRVSEVEVGKGLWRNLEAASVLFFIEKRVKRCYLPITTSLIKNIIPKLFIHHFSPIYVFWVTEICLLFSNLQNFFWMTLPSYNPYGFPCICLVKIFDSYRYLQHWSKWVVGGVLMVLGISDFFVGVLHIYNSFILASYMHVSVFCLFCVFHLACMFSGSVSFPIGWDLVFNQPLIVNVGFKPNCSYFFFLPRRTYSRDCCESWLRSLPPGLTRINPFGLDTPHESCPDQ
jgi:hypothetical protein